MNELIKKFERWKSTLPSMTSREIELYQRHYDLLLKWNDQVGLVSRKTVGNSPAAHYADGIFMSEGISKFAKRGLLDLGAGAGFPGLIFAIRFPDVMVTVYEKQLRKQTFLTAAVTWLGLENVKVEGAFPEIIEEGFVTARAVMPQSELGPFLRKRMRIGVRACLSAGGKLIEHWSGIECFKTLHSFDYELPEEQGWRHCHVIERVSRGTKNE